MLYVPRAARVHLTELILTPERVIRERVADDMPCARILIYSFEGELFFGAAPDLQEHFDEIQHAVQPGMRVIVLRLKRARNPDAVCLNLLNKFILRVESQGIIVLLCGIHPDLAQALDACGIAAHLGTGRVFHETGVVWSATLAAVPRPTRLCRMTFAPAAHARDKAWITSRTGIT